MDPAQILGNSGSIARRLPGYEHRPQQLTMASDVAEALAQKRHLIVEAGDGGRQEFCLSGSGHTPRHVGRIAAGSAETRRDLDPYDQPAGTIDEQGPALAEQRDPP